MGNWTFKEHQRSKQLYEVQRRGLGELHSFTKKNLQERIAHASLSHTHSDVRLPHPLGFVEHQKLTERSTNQAQGYSSSFE